MKLKSLLLSVVLVFTLMRVTEIYAASPTQTTPSLPPSIVVYSKQVDAKEYLGGAGRYDLFALRLPARTQQRLTNHQANPKLSLGGAISNPQISPDGTRVLFLANYADVPEEHRMSFQAVGPDLYGYLNVWLLDLKSGQIVPVTKGAEGWFGIQWSPDGKQFCAVYPSAGATSLQNRPPNDYYVFDAKTLRRRRVARVLDQSGLPFWATDGKHLHWYRQEGNLILHTVSTEGRKTLRRTPMPYQTNSGIFSPDGKYLAWVRSGNELHLKSLTSTYTQRLMVAQKPHGFRPSGDALCIPIWSPDGKWVAILERVFGESSGRLADCTRAFAGGGRVTRSLHNLALVTRWEVVGCSLSASIPRFGGGFSSGWACACPQGIA